MQFTENNYNIPNICGKIEHFASSRIASSNLQTTKQLPIIVILEKNRYICRHKRELKINENS